MSFFSPRASLADLARLCRHVAMSTGAGIDERTVWTRQAEMSRAALRPHVQRIRDRVASGGAVSEALREGGDFFPDVFVRLVEVGERGGALPDVFLRLADHYDQRIGVRRMFLTRLAWPAVQFAFALAVVGFFIWLSGFLSQGRRDRTIDPLGLGLSGTAGLAIYLTVLAAVLVVGAVLIRGVVRGAAWARWCEPLLLAVPGVGTPWRTLGLARLTWTLRLTLNTSMDVREAAALALESTGLRWYANERDRVVAALDRGMELHEAFRASQAFPADFLDALTVAETSGQTVEYMDRLSRDYERRADSALKSLAVVASFVIWALVAALIVTLIFRLFFSYLGMFEQIQKG